MSWEDRAACKDRPDLTWFPEPSMFGKGKGTPRGYLNAIAAAQLVCRSCPVRVECAKAGEFELGIWGGELHLWNRTPKAPRVPAPCGTAAGAKRHRRNGENPCDACREANTVQRAICAERRSA